VVNGVWNSEKWLWIGWETMRICVGDSRVWGKRGKGWVDFVMRKKGLWVERSCFCESERRKEIERDGSLSYIKQRLYSNISLFFLSLFYSFLFYFIFIYFSWSHMVLFIIPFYYVFLFIPSLTQYIKWQVLLSKYNDMLFWIHFYYLLKLHTLVWYG